MRAVGVDLGGTFIKSAALDLEHRQIGHVASVPFPPFSDAPTPGVREVDPLAVLEAVRDQIARVRALAPDSEAVYLCGQMHGTVLLDAEGEPLVGASTWQDTRTLTPRPDGTTTYERLDSALGAGDREALGDPPKPGYPLALALHRAQAGELPPGAQVCSLLDFVAARLAGVRPVTDPTNASATGAYDWRSGAWHQGVLARLGLAGLRWPVIVPSGAAIGRYEGLTVHAPLGDQQAALLGALLGPGELSLNVGTGSQASTLDAQPAPGPYQIRPYLGDWRLKTITHLPAGRALNVLFGLVTELCPGDEAAAWRAIEARVAEAEPAGLRANLAFFPSRLGDRGSLEGIREHHFGVGDLFAAAYDAMAEAYASAAEALGGTFSGVVLSGGLPHRSAALRARIEARLGRPARLSACQEETLLGLLVLALGPTETTRAELLARAAAGHAWIA